MGLFSRKKVSPSHRDFQFSREELDRKMRRIRREVYDDRNTESHRVFIGLIETMRSLELLNLGSPKDGTLETYHYNRGRIDALSNLLRARDTIIADGKKEKEAKQKGKAADNKTARSYIKPGQPSQAGLSI